MALPACIVLLIILLYCLTIFRFYLALGRTSQRKAGQSGLASDGPDHEPGLQVSILIPFRNERKNLPYLLNDLLAQTYPADRMEVLCINDHSEDGSACLFDSLSRTSLKLSCLDLPEGKSGKKEALAYGMDQASGRWIIQMDADGRIGPGFVTSHMDFLEKNPSDLVAGLVSTGKGKGRFLEHFERLDQLSLTGVGAASFHAGRPMMCSGANLAYSRELYVQTRRYDPSRRFASGDDMFLMIGARKLGKVLSFNLDREALVLASPSVHLRSLIHQRVRWGTKSTGYRMPDIQGLALLVMLTHVSVVLFPLWIALYPPFWPYFLVSWIAKTTVDFLLLRKMTGYTRQRKSMPYFLPSSLVYYPVYLAVLLRMIFPPPAWKGKQIR